MNNYEICILINRFAGVLAIIALTCFILICICDIVGSLKSLRIEKVTGSIFILSLVISLVLCIGHEINKSKCQTIIENKIEAEYEDFKLTSGYDSNSAIDDTFEFMSNGITYEAHYSIDQDAIIIKKINFKGVQKIKNVFGK